MLTTQSAAIAVLAAIIVLPHDAASVSSSATNTYHTVTTTAQSDQPIIHVVFDDAIRLADLKDILFRSNLQVASGPTATGVYSLSPVGRAVDFDVRAVAHALRNDPRIRFAEVSHE